MKIVEETVSPWMIKEKDHMVLRLKEILRELDDMDETTTKSKMLLQAWILKIMACEIERFINLYL